MNSINIFDILTVISVIPAVLIFLSYIWKKFIHALYKGLKKEHDSDIPDETKSTINK